VIGRRLALVSASLVVASAALAETGLLEVPGGRIAWERTGRGPSLVLVHDGLLPSASWDAVWPALAQGFDVLRYDRRGYGASSSTTADFDNAADLLALLDAQKLAKVALVGASAGGGLALDFTLDHPERVSALVLEGPVLSGFSYSSHYSARGIRNTGSPRYRPQDAETAIANWADDAYMTDARNAEGRRRLRALLERFPQSAQGRVKGSTRPPPDSRARLASLHLPVRLLVGESDIPDVHAHVGAIEHGVAGAERLVVPQAGHLIHLERPDTFVRLVSEFVDPEGTARGLLAGGLGTPASAATRALFDYDVRAPLDVQEKGVETRGTALVHDVHFASPLGGRAPASVVEPAAPGAARSRAGLVFLHHGQGDRSTFLDEAVAWAGRGVVSVLLDAPANREELPVSFFDPELDATEVRQTVIELRRCFDLLLTRKDVDPRRLAYVGWSLGGTMGSRLAGLEPRARGFVMMAGWASLSDAARNGHGLFHAGFEGYAGAEQQQAWLARLEPLDGTHFLDGRSALLLQFAARDAFISRVDAALFRAAAGPRAESRDYDVGHFGLGAGDAARDREAWLATLLRLSPR
jgi:pimeloyl-ACP methyl ester carboxylesterase